MNGIDFVLTEQTLYVSLNQGLVRESLSANNLSAQLKSSELRNCLLDENAFNNVVNKVRSTDETMFRVGQCLPYVINFEVSEDDMQVHATLRAPYGGEPLSMNVLLKSLRALGITMGIRRLSMEKLVEHSQQADPGEELSLLIARGRPAVDGEDTKFEALAQDARDRVLKPQKVDGDKVDMRNLGEIISVEAGTPLLRRIPATHGTPGFSVKGDTLEPVPGLNRDLQPGQGSAIDENDPNILVATRQGLPRLMDNTAHVDDVLSMRKVDATTGHVNYEGSVVISGNVGPGMRIVAGGDVTVTGYVDSAFIEAEGNVTVAKGVIGQQAEEMTEELTEEEAPHEHSTQIIAQGSIWVSYSQYATLRGIKGVIVDKQLTHCHVITEGALCLGGEGKEARGKLIGGIVDTNTHVSAGQIGAPAGAKTCINISSPQASEEYLQETEQLGSQLRDELASIEKLKKVHKRAKQDMPDEQFKKFLTPLQQKIENHRRNVTVLRIKIQELRKRAPERQSIIVHANRVLYSGVLFHSDYETKRINENRGPSTLILKNGSFSYQYVG